MVRQCASGNRSGSRKFTSQSRLKAASRSSVNTNNDENSPMHSRPAQLSPSASGGLASCRAISPSGTIREETINRPASQSTAAGNADRCGSKRQPM